MPRGNLVLVIVGLLNAAAACAGEFNRKLDIGQPAPVWTDLPGVDDKAHSLADLKDKDVVVVIFTCNHCPVAQDYEDRIIEFTKKHAASGSKVAVVGISVSRLPEDQLPKMKDRAQKKGFDFLYLHDASQKIGRAYGATLTPEFFVLNKERKVVYMGAMDNHINPAKVKTHYLEDAVEATLKGEKPAKPETCPIGCSVEYQKVAGK